MKLNQFSRMVGWRYLRAKKGSSFLSVITAMSVAGVAIGVFSMILILSVMAGFEHEMKKRLFQAECHIRIDPLVGKNSNFELKSESFEKLKKVSQDIVNIFPVIQTEVILRSGKRVAGAVLKGIGTDQDTRIREHVTEWAPEAALRQEGSKLLLGSELALELGVIPGDILSIVSPVEVEGPLGAVPRIKNFIVEGIYKTGVPEQELHETYTDHGSVQSFLKEHNKFTQIEIIVNKLDNANSAADGIRRWAGTQYLVRSWQEMNAHLFASLKLEKMAMFCMLAFITIVASFNILSMLTMTVIEKRKSLSILRAMGATPSQIGSIVFWQAGSIGIIGSLIGLFIGLSCCILLKTYPVIELPDFYYDRTLPVLIQPILVFLVVLVTLGIVFIGSNIPARKASRLSPLDGIKNN